MTLHARKGLEFPVVAVIEARQPVAGGDAGAAEEGDPFEEMRSFYGGYAGDGAGDRGQCGEALTAEGVLVPRGGCKTATQQCQPSSKSLNFAPVPTVLAHE